MVLQITVKNLDKIADGVVRLPDSLQKATVKDITQMMKEMQKGAKIRAPVWKGELREGITLDGPRKKGAVTRWILSSEAKHSIFWEKGFNPHLVSRGRRSSFSFTVGDWMKEKGIGGRYLYAGSKKNKQSFMGPAFKQAITDLDSRLSRSIRGGIKEAGFR